MIFPIITNKTMISISVRQTILDFPWLEEHLQPVLGFSDQKPFEWQPSYLAKTLKQSQRKKKIEILLRGKHWCFTSSEGSFPWFPFLKLYPEHQLPDLYWFPWKDSFRHWQPVSEDFEKPHAECLFYFSWLKVIHVLIFKWQGVGILRLLSTKPERRKLNTLNYSLTKLSYFTFFLVLVATCYFSNVLVNLFIAFFAQLM